MNNQQSCLLAADTYYYDIKDKEKAYNLYKASCESFTTPSGRGCHSTAHLHGQKFGDQQILDYFLKACKNGHSESCNEHNEQSIFHSLVLALDVKPKKKCTAMLVRYIFLILVNCVLKMNYIHSVYNI